jgi:hypothetical protein
MQDIQLQIDELKAQIELLKRSSSIPRDVENAFVERLGTRNISSAVIGSGTTNAQTQNITITSTPQTITVPAQPSGALSVTFNGVTYNLLYK